MEFPAIQCSCAFGADETRVGQEKHFQRNKRKGLENERPAKILQVRHDRTDSRVVSLQDETYQIAREDPIYNVLGICEMEILWHRVPKESKGDWYSKRCCPAYSTPPKSQHKDGRPTMLKTRCKFYTRRNGRRRRRRLECKLIYIYLTKYVISIRIN